MTTSPDSPIAKPLRRRRWRRRIVWTLSIFIVLMIAVRSLLPLMLPVVLQKVAGIYGLTCAYDRMELNLFSGDAGVWGIRVVPKEGGPAVLETDYVHGNISVMALMRGKLSVWRAEADGVDVNLDRNADGHIPLLDRFIAATSAAPTNPAPTASPRFNSIDLTSPLKLDALRLGHLRVHIHDRGVTPEIDTELAMDLRLNDLGSATAPAKFEMNLSVDPFLDGLKITGEGTSGGKRLDAKFNVLCRGIRLKPAAVYLAPLGIMPVCDSITLRASGAVHTLPAPNNAEGFNGSLVLDHLSATTDTTEALACDQMSLGVDLIDTKSIRLGKLLIDGVRGSASRAADGNLQVAGIEYKPVASPVTPPALPKTNLTRTQPTAPAAPAAPSPIAGLLAEPWSLAEISIKNARLDLHDQAVTPAVNLSLINDQFLIRNINHDPKNPATVVTLTARSHAPGVVNDIQIDGQVKPFADKKTAHFTLNAAGIGPVALRPYLNLLHLETRLHHGVFTAALDASASLPANGDLLADATLSNIRLADDADLLSLNAVSINGITITPATARLTVQSVLVDGPSLPIIRENSGELSALGIVTDFLAHPPTVAPAAVSGTGVPAPAPAALAASATTPAAGPSMGATGSTVTLAGLPRVSIGQFQWKNIRLDLEDRKAAEPVKLLLSDIGVQVDHFTTELGENQSAPVGHLRAHLTSPQLAKLLQADGTLQPHAHGLDADITVSGEGITLAGIKSYLKPLGIEPVLTDGTLSLHARASVSQAQPSATASTPATSALTASLGVDHVRFSDGDTEWAGVDEASLSKVSLVSGELNVDSIHIVRPRAVVRRQADGAFVAAGIRYRLLAPVAGAAPQSTSPAAAGAGTPTTAPAISAVAAPAVPFAVSVNHLDIQNSQLQWDDAAVSPTVQTTAGATVRLDHFTFGKPAEPAALSVIAHVDNIVDDVNVTGSAAVQPDGQSVKLDVTATGVRAGPLAAYLPKNLQVKLADGRLRTSLDAGIAKNPAGGLAAHLIVGATDFRDGTAEIPLLRLDGARVIMPRIDLPDTALNVQELSATGIETHAERTADGSLQMLGVAVVKPPADAAAVTAKSTVTAPSAVTAPAAGAALGQPPASASQTAVTVEPAAPTVSIADLVAASHKALPELTVDKVQLTVKSLTLADLSRPQSQPLVVRDFDFHNVNAVDWLGKNAAAKPPSQFEMSCAIDPVIDQMRVQLAVTPFAATHNLRVDFAANGVHGNGLTALVPELKHQLDGSDLTQGTASGHFEAEAKWDHRSPIDFDLSHGLEAGFLLEKVYYRAKPDGPVLAGVDEVQSDNIHIQPKTGDVHIRRFDITKPIGLITQDAAGIHAMGWVVKLPPAGASPTTAPTTAPAVVVVRETPAPVQTAAAGAAPVPAGGEILLDKLVISGLDAQFTDYAVNPPLMIPLNGLEVEVRNLSSRAMQQDLPIRFTAVVNAGKVKLKKPQQSGGGIAGLLGGAASALSGNAAQPPAAVVMEDRDLFSQITASGEVSLYPKPHGWVKTSVSALDLAALEGVARQQGVTLTNGLYDSEVDVKLNPDGSVATQSRFVLTDLSLSEPPNGPISRVLHLPAPLDTAIGAVQGSDGSIVFPLNVAVQPENLSYTDIGLAAANGVSQVLVTAIASSPVKAVNDVAGLLGLGGEKKSRQAVTMTIPFKPGATTFFADSQEAFNELLAKLKSDPSLTVTITCQLGAGDAAIAAERANPPLQQCQSLQLQLRTHKTQLLALRGDTAGRARALLLGQGQAAAEPSLKQLSAIDRDLAATENSLDQVCELLRPGAERQADRRTRAAGIEIAGQRLAAVKSALLQSGLPGISDRVKVIEARYSPGTDWNGAVNANLVQTR